MISQHWFRWWLGAIRQQAITWANVDPVFCRHMASLGPNELSSKMYYRKIMQCLQAKRFGVTMIMSIWNLTGASAALQPRCLSKLRMVNKLQICMLWFWDFRRFSNKKSYHLVNRDTVQGKWVWKKKHNYTMQFSLKGRIWLNMTLMRNLGMELCFCEFVIKAANTACHKKLIDVKVLTFSGWSDDWAFHVRTFLFYSIIFAVIIYLIRYSLSFALPWVVVVTDILTHCGLVTPYGNRDLGQHWLR